MNICVVCDKPNNAVSIEHIVPESLGNKTYVVERSKICDACNNRFAKFEGVALSDGLLAMDRARNGIRTKKSKNVKGTINGLKIEGDKSYQKGLVTVDKGKRTDEIFSYDSNGKITTLKVGNPFNDKNSVAISKKLFELNFFSYSSDMSND